MTTEAARRLGRLLRYAAAPLILIGLASVARPASRPCESLTKLQLPNTRIASARSVAAGAFTPPEGAPGSGYHELPAFCRVVAELAPTSDSDIKIEVWMPQSGWNGRFRGQANGGFAGSIDYPQLAAAVKRGYASAGTDTGHTGSAVDAAWALGHPQKVIDFGYRGIHEMTVKAKAIVAAFYGESPRRMYFAGCSDGGREALMEAERYPRDYDGILAGAPANFWTHLLTAAMWDVQATTFDPASYIPAAKIPAISRAVVAACDAQDGVKDGILNDPRECHFDPSTLACHGAESDACLTTPQVTALKKIYQGPRDSAGHSVFPGLMPGGEDGPGGWSLWITGAAPGRSLIADFGIGYFTDFVYQKPGWDPKTFSVDRALKLADAKTASALNATNSNLEPFRSHGAKLIIYHGWSDAAIAPVNTINYYRSVVAVLGENPTRSFVRLYMVPGMQHCGGGPGPDHFGQVGDYSFSDPQRNVYMALEQWVEKGTPPSQIIATKLVDDRSPASGIKMTRPLCAYPQESKYRGSGDPNDAANFACAAGNP